MSVAPTDLLSQRFTLPRDAAAFDALQAVGEDRRRLERHVVVIVPDPCPSAS